MFIYQNWIFVFKNIAKDNILVFIFMNYLAEKLCHKVNFHDFGEVILDFRKFLNFLKGDSSTHLDLIISQSSTQNAHYRYPASTACSFSQIAWCAFGEEMVSFA